MGRIRALLLLTAAVFASQAFSQDSGRPVPMNTISGVQRIDDAAGVVFSPETALITLDAGATWRVLGIDLGLTASIADVRFSDRSNGVALIAGSGTLTAAVTADGGLTWSTLATVRPAFRDDEHVAGARFADVSPARIVVEIPIVTSSNFTGSAEYESLDRGSSWQLVARKVEIRRDDTPVEISSRGWLVKTEGVCSFGKFNCRQETKLLDTAGRDITPSEMSSDASRAALLPPGGSTRISLNRGFDKCTAAPASQMQTWWDNSPLYDSNIYISGRNRGCSQPQLTAAWVNQVSSMGWGLIPTIVGYQSPCSVSTSSVKHSSDPAVAETQGRGEADIAVADATNLGITTGSVLYYDMERYDDVSGTGACSTPTKAFLKGWTDRVKELGYKSGVYGSPTNAVGDWINIPAASRMDAVWLARWDNNPSVWSYASPSPAIPAGNWENHQRIKQWQAPHNETWGGVTFNIDGNNADGPVAGIAKPRNKNADFDGDGKSDVSVFRPESGIWFVLASSNFTLSGVGFGNGTDAIAPGDFDGDGKTDYVIFRPADGYWHMLTKANAYSTRQFGANGDIPVPADFNGDGKTDFAVWRPSNGVWYIANSDSRGTFTFVQFGQAGDKPVQGDYDGDGKTDLAVWRPSNGVWYILRSSDQGLQGIGFGLSTDLPAQGDYDGDGRADQAVFRDGYWYLLQSTAGFGVVPFGSPGDRPVAADFDGDNKTDVAVYRASQGAWYILGSTAGFTAYGFGTSTDRPVEAAYLPE